MEDLAASGGYWLACVGEKIYIAKTSVLGSIGVINYSLGFVELIQKQVQQTVDTFNIDLNCLLQDWN